MSKGIEKLIVQNSSLIMKEVKNLEKIKKDLLKKISNAESEELIKLENDIQSIDELLNKLSYNLEEKWFLKFFLNYKKL